LRGGLGLKASVLLFVPGELERGDGVGVELRASLTAELGEREFGRRLRGVGTLADEAVERVADRDDPGAERNRGGGQAVGVAAPVPALAAGSHERRDR
jgi:hypothetical protein